ncbi:MAG: hypothetical protein K0U72_06535 [Gammaproteobacteria bacterium]|nr:hypothetical protein [Gammaproteobacteria bacterium]
MDIWADDKLALFIAFVIPGFISLKVYELIEPGARQKTSEQLVDAVAYSCINYAILALPITAIESGDLYVGAPKLYYSFYLFVLLIFPVLLALAWRFLRTREFFQKNAPHPTGLPWDHVFSKRKSYWIRITLGNGKVIGGRYAHNSFASSAPSKEQLYLEEAWIIDDKGGFVRKKDRSAGVIVLASDISHIDLLEQ